MIHEQRGERGVRARRRRSGAERVRVKAETARTLLAADEVERVPEQQRAEITLACAPREQVQSPVSQSSAL